MHNDCDKCGGDGEIECECCNQMRKCALCNGEGVIDCHITDFQIPKNHKHKAELERLRDDADQCVSDYTKLVAMNPRAKESYDSQLTETIELLTTKAEKLLE
jgi:DnaJ-class molecular chaperone